MASVTCQNYRKNILVYRENIMKISANLTIMACIKKELR
jgi:hypothetical protein